MIVKRFFKQYPKAPRLFKVGDTYYMDHQRRAAEMQARIEGIGVEEIPNPKLKPKVKEQNPDQGTANSSSNNSSNGTE